MDGSHYGNERKYYNLNRPNLDDGLYVLDLAGDYNRSKKKLSSDLEQMMENSIIIPSIEEGFKTIIPKQPLLHPLKSQTSIEQYKKLIHIHNEDVIKLFGQFGLPTQTPKVGRLEDSSLFSVEAKTELKVLSKHVYRRYLINSPSIMNRQDVTHELTESLLPTISSIDDVFLYYADIPLSPQNQRCVYCSYYR